MSHLQRQRRTQLTSFESEMLFEGVYTPDQLAVMRAVYNAVVSEPWFSTSPEKKRQFASFVINSYRLGMVAPDRLQAYCRVAAEQRFSETHRNADQICIANTI